MASLTGNGGHVVGKSGVIDRVNAGSDAGVSGGVTGQLCHQLGVLGFAAYWGTILAVQGDIKNASTELLRHFSL
jgi:hypothetical protein